MPSRARVIDLPLPLRLLGAAAAGAAVGLGFAPMSLWPSALLGLAGVTLLVAGRSKRGAAAVGYAFGLGLCAVAISWLHGLGWWIAVLLCAVVAAFQIPFALLTRLVVTLPAWPVWVACAWTSIEWLTCRWPFGGFGWIRLGWIGLDTPLQGLYPHVGASGVGLAICLLGQGLAWAASTKQPTRRWGVVVAAMLLAGLAGVTGGALAPRPDAAVQPVTVGAVQGNINGVDPREPFGRARTVTLNHLSETVTLMAKARAGVVPTPDLVLWPENSTDVDPLLDAQTRDIVEAASEVADRPILVGAVLEGPGENERQTAGLWWETDGRVTARYEKRNLVPFGEFIPFRDFFLPRFPLLRLTGAQSVPGTKPGVLDVTVGDGRHMAVGDVICFELAWDSTVYDTVRHGAQFLLVQSNNASYGGSAQIPQQWAMTRVRAMETGRWVAVATTNSLSGFIAPDGSVVSHSREFTNWSDARALTPSTHQTAAPFVAPIMEGLAAAAGLVAAAVAGWTSRRRRA